MAANLNNVEEGIGGSGIYGANGSIFSYYLSGSEGSKLQIATVKNVPTHNNTAFVRNIFFIINWNFKQIGNIYY